MSDKIERGSVTKNIVLSAFAAIAFSNTVAGSSQANRNYNNEPGDGLEAVYNEYNVSVGDVKFAKRELPHYLEGTEIHDKKIVAAPDHVETSSEKKYDIYLETSEFLDIVKRAGNSYEQKYGVHPNSPSVKRFGDKYLPKEFVEDLYRDVVFDEDKISTSIDVENVTGKSRSELRQEIQDTKECDNICCSTQYAKKSQAEFITSTGETTPPGTGHNTPTAFSDELHLYAHAPPTYHPQHPYGDVFSDTREVFDRFNGDELDGYGADDTTASFHIGLYNGPTTDDSAIQLDEFSQWAYDEANDGGISVPDSAGELGTLWLDEMDHRGRARFPGFYSVNAISSSGNLPSQAWSNTTLLQHEIGHNFGCYKTTDVGHDENQDHHNWYSTTSCVMHYVTQL